MKTKKLPKGRPNLPYADVVAAARAIDVAGLSDEELKVGLCGNEVQAWRYAALAEIILRIKGLRLFDTQLATAAALQNGRIAELPTGEGKTLAAVVAAACFALQGRRVHVLVFNDYLAKRDWADNKEIYAACGLRCGYINQQSTSAQRRAAYAGHVTYVSAKEAGFDTLRDFLCAEKEELVFPGFDVAIVDEADSILIDEGRTPLVLAGALPVQKDEAEKIDRCVQRLRKGEVETEAAAHQAWLTDEGIDHMEQMLGVSLYDGKNLELLAGVQSALEAHCLLHRDEDYIVKNGEVQIVESTTGRVVHNKRYPDLLHRAVEVKEGLEPAPLTMIYNQITMRHFLLQYKTLCGMTGTIATAAEEVDETYELEVDMIGPHTPCVRADHKDAVFMDAEEYFDAVVQQVKHCRQKGQPVLMGTQSVAESEEFSRLFGQEGIEHVVLNAKNDEEEARLIAKAGEAGRVTISTNMAGRGVDIRLGGRDGKGYDAVVASGGLYVLGAGIHPSLRIDNQLRGRAGRQGDPGESRFFVCLQDTQLAGRITGLQKARAQLGDEKRKQNIVRSLQRQMEGEAAQSRYVLMRFSRLPELQRQEVTQWRCDILLGNEQPGFLQKEDPEKFAALCRAAGEEGVRKAERQLALYYIAQHWAGHLSTLDALRSGIHLTSVGRRNPLDEYHRAAIAAYEDMVEMVKQDVVHGMRTLHITAEGIDMEKEGFAGGTTTWTYAIDESAGQFNRLRALMVEKRDELLADDGALTNLYVWWKGLFAEK